MTDTMARMETQYDETAHGRFVPEALRVLFPLGTSLGAYREVNPDELDDQQRGQVHRLAVVLAEHQAEKLHLQKFARMVSDLDRNENGRHEGDVDGNALSEGNPLLKTGDTLGYGLGGSTRYVMPERGKRHDPDAWVAR